MKKTTEDWLIILVGGPLFGLLFRWKFPQSANVIAAIAVGVLMAILIVAMRRIFGDQTLPRFLLVSSAAGAMVGLAVWWLTGRQIPWYFYALPCSLFFLTAGAFDRLTTKRESTLGSDTGHGN